MAVGPAYKASCGHSYVWSVNYLQNVCAPACTYTLNTVDDPDTPSDIQTYAGRGAQELGRDALMSRTCKVGALQGAQAVNVLGGKGGLSAETADCGGPIECLGEAGVHGTARHAAQAPYLPRRVPVVPLPI